MADVQGQREIPPESLPMTRTNHRHFQEGNRKTVFTWDIDKTYLATETDKLADLLRTAFEFAIDKRELLGTVPLLKGLRRGMGGDDWIPPIYFVSASPSQMRGVLERKMLLDGVEPDGVTLKGQISLLFKWGPSALRRQIGYKLGALLMYRLERPGGMNEILFGDDSESDPFIYSLYRDVVLGDWTPEDLERRLAEKGEPPAVRKSLVELAERVHAGPYVGEIFIQLTGRRAAPENGEFPGVFFVRNALQSALLLERAGHVDEWCVKQVAATFASGQGILRTLEDGMERELYSEEVFERWKSTLCD